MMTTSVTLSKFYSFPLLLVLVFTSSASFIPRSPIQSLNGLNGPSRNLTQLESTENLGVPDPRLRVEQSKLEATIPELATYMVTITALRIISIRPYHGVVPEKEGYQNPDYPGVEIHKITTAGTTTEIICLAILKIIANYDEPPLHATTNTIFWNNVNKGSIGYYPPRNTLFNENSTEASRSKLANGNASVSTDTLRQVDNVTSYDLGRSNPSVTIVIDRTRATLSNAKFYNTLAAAFGALAQEDVTAIYQGFDAFSYEYDASFTVKASAPETMNWGMISDAVFQISDKASKENKIQELYGRIKLDNVAVADFYLQRGRPVGDPPTKNMIEGR